MDTDYIDSSYTGAAEYVETVKRHKGKIIAAIVVAVIVIIIIIVVIMLVKNKSTFAGFAAKYRGIDSYQNVDPIANFYYQNRELRKRAEMGTITIEEAYYIYKSFYNNPNVQNVPVDIMNEVQRIVMFIESGRDFTIPETTDFKTLMMAIINMDRLLVQYLDSLKLSKNTLGGTDPHQEKVYNDYLKVNSLGTGYIEGVLDAIDVAGLNGNDTNRARKMAQDIKEEIGIQLQMGQSDPVRYNQYTYDYSNKISEPGMFASGKSAEELYRDKRFPGTYERKILRDEPTIAPDKDYKDPNVPRPGIIGRVADDPYHYDIHAKNFVRSF